MNPAGHQKDLERLQEGVEAAWETGDLATAIDRAEEARRRYPEEPDVLMMLADLYWEADVREMALECYQAAANRAPRSHEIQAALGWAYFGLAQFEAAREAAQRSSDLAENAEACALLGRMAERDGSMQEADRQASRACVLDPESFHAPFRISESEFRSVVQEALDLLPDEFRAALEGEVAVLVEPVPSLETLTPEGETLDPELLGLYSGVPLPEREVSSTVPQLPDVIHLYHHNLEHEARTREQLVHEIAVTVYHEVGHYFGFDDDELDELDYG